MVNYTLTINPCPNSLGTTDPAAGAHVYAADTEVTVTATPNSKMEFSFFIADGVQSWTNPLVVTMTEDITVTPHFGSIVFGNVIRNLEKKNVSHSIWEPGIWEPGMFECGVFCEVIRSLEK